MSDFLKYVVTLCAFGSIFMAYVQCEEWKHSEEAILTKRQLDAEDDAEISRDSRGAFTDWFLLQKGVIDDSDEARKKYAKYRPSSSQPPEKSSSKPIKSKFFNHWCDWFGKHNHTTNDSRLCGPDRNRSSDDIVNKSSNEMTGNIRRIQQKNIADPKSERRLGSSGSNKNFSKYSEAHFEEMHTKPSGDWKSMVQQLPLLLNSNPPVEGEVTSYRRIVVIHKIKQSVGSED